MDQLFDVALCRNDRYQDSIENAAPEERGALFFETLPFHSHIKTRRAQLGRDVPVWTIALLRF